VGDDDCYQTEHSKTVGFRGPWYQSLLYQIRSEGHPGADSRCYLRSKGAYRCSGWDCSVINGRLAKSIYSVPNKMRLHSHWYQEIILLSHCPASRPRRPACWIGFLMSSKRTRGMYLSYGPWCLPAARTKLTDKATQSWSTQPSTVSQS
jgi:hypothetical protein